MKKIVLVLLVLGAQSSLAASGKDAILGELANAYVKAFESENGFAANDDVWNKKVADIQALVDKNKDKDLAKGYQALQAHNKTLVAAYGALMRDGTNTGKFEQVAKDAARERDVLKKVIFVLPGKRDAREVLVTLADYIVNGAHIGNARAQIGVSLETLRTLQDLTPMFAEMEKVRTDAQARGKAIEKEVRDSVDPDLKALEVARAYVEKRKRTRDELKARQALKIEEITALDAELAKLNENISTVYGSLAQMGDQFMMMFMAAQISGLGDAETKAAKLQRKLEKAKRTVLNISLAMEKVDNLIETKVEDPHFERDRNQAMEATKKARADVEETRRKIASLTKEALAGHNKQAGELVKKYEAKAKTLPCKDARTIGGGKRALDACSKMANDMIGKFAADAKLAKVCRSDSLFTACAKAVGKSF